MATQKLEIWNDSGTLAFLRTGHVANDASRDERRRIHKRAQCHRFVGERLLHRRSGEWREVPKLAQRMTLSRRTHEQLSHAKKRAVLADLRFEYYWDGMESDVERVIRACQTCAKTTPRFLARPAKLTQQTTERPFQCVGIDLVNLTKAQGLYLITCVDYFSRWVEVGVLKDKKAETTWEWFKTNILDCYHHHFRVKTVISDNGGEFLSHFTENLKAQGIDHRHITPRHPQSNGLCERFNGTIQTRVRSLLEDACSSSDNMPLEELRTLVSSAVHGYRRTKHSAIRCSPMEVLFGPRHRVTPPPEDPEEALEDIEEWMTEPASPTAIQQRRTHLAQMRRKAALSDQRRREREQRAYSKKRRVGSTEVPSQIYLKNPNKRRKKDPPVIGPYRVLDCSGDQSRLLIQHPDGQEELVPRDDCAECEQTL